MSTYVMPVHRVHMVVSEWNVMGYVSCDGGEGDLFCRMVCLHECEQWHNDREHPCGPEEAPHTLVPLPADKDCCVVTGLDAQGVVDSHEGQPQVVRGEAAPITLVYEDGYRWRYAEPSANPVGGA